MLQRRCLKDVPPAPHKVPGCFADRYHRGATLTDFGNGDGVVRAHIDGHEVVEADVLVPGAGAATTPGKRRLNWVWYVGVGKADLPRILVDRDGRKHHASLPFGGTPDAAIRDLRDLARREVHPMLAAVVVATPQPFLQTIVDVVPTRTVFGRVCLLRDPAFVVRPHP